MRPIWRQLLCKAASLWITVHLTLLILMITVAVCQITTLPAIFFLGKQSLLLHFFLNCKRKRGGQFEELTQVDLQTALTAFLNLKRGYSNWSLLLLSCLPELLTCQNAHSVSLLLLFEKLHVTSLCNYTYLSAISSTCVLDKQKLLSLGSSVFVSYSEPEI